MNHLRSCLRLDQQTPFGYDGPRTLYRHHHGIRDFLQVKAYEKEARRLTIQAVYEAAQVMDNPADLINVALETLIKERYELPAFSTLDRLVRRVRTLVNRRFFQTICSRLQESDLAKLEALLVSDDHTRRSSFNRLKQLPKKPTLSNLQEWLGHLEWLISWGQVGGSLAGLAHLKIKHFAAEAKALDAGEIKDFLPTKRHALLVCLIHRMAIQARDSLASMFSKRMSKILQKGKEELDRLRLQHREKTAELVSLLADVVMACDCAPNNEEIGRQVKTLLTGRGPTQQLLEDCEAVAAYSGDNYHPLLWRYYRNYRRTLFRLVRQLSLASTSQDRSLISTLHFILENEDRRSEWLSGSLDLSFASERWQRTVCRVEDGKPCSTVAIWKSVFSCTSPRK